MANLPIALFNGAICTSNGLYRISDLTAVEARELIQRYSFVSAVGHEASAQVLSDVLGVQVEMNRIQYVQAVGQKAIALVLQIRPGEGEILSAAEMRAIGFCLKLMERLY